MGIVKSRQRVSLIMSGNVYITGEKIDKPEDYEVSKLFE